MCNVYKAKDFTSAKAAGMSTAQAISFAERQYVIQRNAQSVKEYAGFKFSAKDFEQFLTGGCSEGQALLLAIACFTEEGK